MSDASWEFQRALVTALKDATPAIAQARIYDDLPDEVASATAPDEVFPYVHVGEMDSIPEDVSASTGSGDDGEQETITLHVWSRYGGQKEIKQIMQQIKDLLHGQSLTVSGRASAHLYVRSRRSFLEQDGKTRHGVMSIEGIHRN